ncbi:hypothetical protein GOQ27_12235 [Clostridium sp. D2Q-11]|uniref:Uncharacterized protein n=1 Tax=Anaeromonas frigoriresistens TaxID=2683708 RepID=A0A942UW94_9FIRM|nr:hypothetical protein [Anaeromonas frigoriresistens]MBS4539235.1 hypothetical protein [Anaeromonas frigoriresistens]
MSITPFRPYIKMNDHNLIKTFWIKTEEYNTISSSEEIKYEINEMIKELKHRNLKLSYDDFLHKILF